MNPSTFETHLTAFVRRLIHATHGNCPIAPDTPLFETGLIDSLRVLHLIAFVESTLHTTIPDRAITLKNFHSIRAITETFATEAPHEHA